MKLDLSQQYLKGKTYIWWGFSSTTQSIEVLEGKQFLGKTGVRTLFSIECFHGKSISNHSYYAFEDEVLLLPARQFQVTDVLNPAEDLHIITLREVQPPFPLLEPPFILTEFIQTMKKLFSASIIDQSQTSEVADSSN